jgi:hypothetical protein
MEPLRTIGGRADRVKARSSQIPIRAQVNLPACFLAGDRSCPACYHRGMVILKQAVFSVAFAVVTVALAEFDVWAVNQ